MLFNSPRAFYADKAASLKNKKIFVSGWKSIAILPYFDDNIFYNHNNGSPQRFWLWSASQNQTPINFNPSVIQAIQQTQPDIVIFASDHIDHNSKIEIEGYRLFGKSQGYICWKTGIYEPDFYWVFHKIE